VADGPDLSKFQQRLAERRQREAAREEAQKAAQFDVDLIPEEAYERSDDQIELDNAIDRIDIIDAYNRWCGKMRPSINYKRTEGIKISCPIPGHVDNDPSAWINLEKQVWFCGGCQVGGDKFDIAAYRYGMSDYKAGANFHIIREKMAKDFGYTLSKTPGGTVIVTPPVIVPEEPEVEPPQVADVIHLHEDDDESIDMPSLDWRPVCPPGTFLDSYMRATVVDDVPEEYHFFHALIALGFAIGRDVTLYDSVPIFGNLFICTLGRSGVGKSKARKHLDALLYAALPYDRRNIPNKGVLKVNAPGSAEALIYQFMAPVEDPSNPKRILFYAPVKGLIDFNELSSLTGRTSRMGSVMKPTLMQFYDMEPIIQTSSMTTGSKEAHEPFASALTTSQPKALRDLISASDDASGFLNRWLFIPGKEKRRYSVGGVRVDMTSCIKPLQDVLGWAGTFGTEQVEWSEEALVVWDKFFQDTLEPLRKKAQNDLLVRIDLTLKKLMLLFSANRMESVLSEQSVADALHCFPYFKAAYGIPEAQIGNTVNNEISDTIMYQVNKYNPKGGITAAKMWDNIKHKKYDKKKFLEVLTTLTKLELISEIATKQGAVGKPTVRYRKNAG
jgi:hypothetical protein